MDNDKENFFQPIKFWSDTVKLLDSRIAQIASTYGFGEVALVVKIKHGKVLDVVFREEVAVRQEEKNGDKQIQENAD